MFKESKNNKFKKIVFNKKKKISKTSPFKTKTFQKVCFSTITINADV